MTTDVEDQLGAGFEAHGFREVVRRARRLQRRRVMQLMWATVNGSQHHYELADGTSFDVGPGEAYDVPAGSPHDEWVVGDAVCRVIDVWPATNAVAS